MPSRDDLRRLRFINSLFAHATGNDLYLAEQIKSAIALSLADLEAQATEHPELAGKRARIELRCTHMPDTRALELLGLIHDQLAFQEIKMQVVVRNDEGRMSDAEGMTKSE